MGRPRPKFNAEETPVENPADEDDIVAIYPQEGPQTKFAVCEADIAILGGAAGGGKSYSLLMEPLRNVKLSPDYAAVIFRRTTPSITNPGSLWDTAAKVYIDGHAIPFESNPRRYEWVNHDNEENVALDVWKSGAKVQFSHLEHEKTVMDWHGAQVPFIGFDELTEFTEYQFWYMVSRNRSTCGVRPYVRATCNADSESWVARLIEWWIDQDTGFPIPERDGVIRYFIRVGDELKWASSREELSPERLGIPRFNEEGKEQQYMIKSLTFIAANIYDNQVLMKTNPEYLGSLMSLPKVQRERLLRGNWKIKPAPGLHFQRDWCEMIDIEQVPKNLTFKRGYDLAATEKTALNDPDWTCGTLLGKDTTGKDPYTYVIDHQYAQESSQKVEKRLRITASQDGIETEVVLPQDPAQAGKSQKVYLMRALDGYNVRFVPQTKQEGGKLTRFGPFSSVAEAGLVKVVRDYRIVGGKKEYVRGKPWNDRWFNILESFPPEGDGHDDDVDSTSIAFNAFNDGTTGMLDYYRGLAEKKRQETLEANRPTEKPTLEKGGVCFTGPPGCNVLYDVKGQPIFANEQGLFIVDDKQAKMLRRPNSGFTEVTT